jgi:DNA-binding NarL/FixJ family response regulator
MADEVIRILIADDHPVVRDGIRGMFTGDPGFEVVAEAGTGREAVARAAAHRPDVVLMDLRMPNGDGVWATAQIVDRDMAKVLVLTTYDTESDVLPAVEAGATGYLLKDTPRHELVSAVRAAARGESVLSPPVARRLMGRVRRPEQGTLSDRELEILLEVAKGATNKRIAEHLFISEATVKTHLLHIYEKLEVGDRAAAVAAGYERGLITPGDGSV